MKNRATTPDVVSLKHINKSYFLAGGQEIPILHDVDLTIKKGEMVALIGPSGSGKSTLMNIIGCLDIATSGQYCFCGQSVEELSSDALAELRSSEISFVFQSFHLLSSKTVYQNVMLPLIYRRTFTDDRDEAVRHALKTAQLDEAQWHKRPNQLSGGQRQRVAIARALVAAPTLLLADEPTGNLDSHTGDNIIEALQHLNDEFGTTILIVTHDDSLTEVVDRVITIKDGYVTEAEKTRV